MLASITATEKMGIGKIMSSAKLSKSSWIRISNIQIKSLSIFLTFSAVVTTSETLDTKAPKENPAIEIKSFSSIVYFLTIQTLVFRTLSWPKIGVIYCYYSTNVSENSVKK